MLNRDKDLTRLVQTALLAALCTVATMIIQIPAPTGGYVNLGDCMVLLSAWMLGPIYGAVASGFGSMLADVLSGYLQYAPATFFIKALMAIAAAVIFTALHHAEKHSAFLPRVLAAIAAESIMVAGYFAFESVFLGYGLAALANMPANLIQSFFSFAAALMLSQMLIKGKVIRL